MGGGCTGKEGLIGGRRDVPVGNHSPKEPQEHSQEQLGERSPEHSKEHHSPEHSKEHHPLISAKITLH